MSSPFVLERPVSGLFICGTDTDVGKTYVSCEIAKSLVANGLSVGVYKPVASGGFHRDGHLVAEDAEALREAAVREEPLSTVCPQVFASPLAPPVAAAEEGRRVDPALLRSGLRYWSDRCDLVIVEGTGGLLSPLSEEDFTVTLAQEFGYPIVLVAADRLGVINHVLQSLCTLKTYADEVPIAGIVLNQIEPERDASCASNGAQICEHSGVPLLGNLGWHSPAPLRTLDWQALATAAEGTR